MIDPGLVMEILNKFGPWGLIILYGAYKIGLPIWKKRRGTYVSYSGFDERFKKIEAEVKTLTADAGKIEIELQKLKAVQEEINRSIYKRLDQLHDSVSGVRETLDKHFAIIMDALRSVKGGR